MTNISELKQKIDGLPDEPNLPPGWGTLEYRETNDDGTFMDYVSVPKEQYTRLAELVEKYEKAMKDAEETIGILLRNIDTVNPLSIHKDSPMYDSLGISRRRLAAALEAFDAAIKKAKEGE